MNQCDLAAEVNHVEALRALAKALDHIQDSAAIWAFYAYLYAVHAKLQPTSGKSLPRGNTSMMKCRDSLCRAMQID